MHRIIEKSRPSLSIFTQKAGYYMGASSLAVKSVAATDKGK